MYTIGETIGIISAIFCLILLPVFVAQSASAERLKIIPLKGTYFEIGRSWGKALKTDLKRSIDQELGGIARFVSKDKKELTAMSNKLIPVANRYDPEFMQVLKGMADGSGLFFEDLFALRSLLELMFYCNKLPAMCTSFAVTADATADGSTIIGQNIDWQPGNGMSLLRITWPNGVEQLSLSLGGIWEYPLSSHPSSPPFGLASNLAVSMTETQNLEQVPISIVMSRASRQKRLERALSVFVNSQQNIAGFILANAEQEIVGIELAANTYEVLFPEEDVMVRANHYLTPRFKDMDFFSRYWPDSYLRNNRLKRLIEKDWGKITPQLMMKKLSDHNNYPKSLCTHVDSESVFAPSQTLASVIMVPEKKIMYIANGNPCETPYLEYRFDSHLQ